MVRFSNISPTKVNPRCLWLSYQESSGKQWSMSESCLRRAYWLLVIAMWIMAGNRRRKVVIRQLFSSNMPVGDT